jgi:hypothetical protein
MKNVGRTKGVRAGQAETYGREGGSAFRPGKKKMGFYKYVRTRSQGLLVVKYDHV